MTSSVTVHITGEPSRRGGRPKARSTPLILAIATLAIALACSPGPTPAADTSREALAAGSSGAPSGSASFVSDLAFTSATNGWGPVERDKSNGEQAAGDGHTISIAGVTYAKGLGVHAASDVRVDVAGQYSSFVSDIGVDDEVAASGGSVVFQVWLDGVKAFDSGIVRGRQAARHVTVSLANVTELRLVVVDDGDGLSFDHADWAGAQVVRASGTGGSGGASGSAGTASGGASSGGNSSGGTPANGGASSGGASAGGAPGAGGSTGAAYVRQMAQNAYVGYGITDQQNIRATLPKPVLQGSALVVFGTAYSPSDPMTADDDAGGVYSELGPPLVDTNEWANTHAFWRTNVNAAQSLTGHINFHQNLEWHGIIVAEIVGVRALGGYVTNLQGHQSAPLTDKQTSGPMSASTPSLLLGLGISAGAQDGPPSAGTGFTSVGTAWNWGGAEGTANLPSVTLEYKLVQPGTVAATFTPVSTVDFPDTFGVLLAE